ncbi:MAG: hypothetical protein ACREBC_33000, partial [Pyrinomonadaceae bacterium]
YTHMGPGGVRMALRSFRENSTPGAVFLADYLPAIGPNSIKLDGVDGDHLPLDDRSFPQNMLYSLSFMERQAANIGLRVVELPYQRLNGHTWLKFTHSIL